MSEPLTYFFLFIFVTVLSSVGVVSGGTGLIVTPILILLGIPPHTAVASYRVGTSGLVITSFIKFHKHKKINYKLAIPLTFFSVLGSLVAVKIVLAINSVMLKGIIASTILFVLMLILSNPEIGTKPSGHITKLKHISGCILAFFISLINIIAGGGGGVLFSYLLLLLYQQTFLESTGTKRITNGIPVLVASIIFMFSGIVDYKLAALLFISTSLGGWFGSAHFLKKGDKYARPFFIAASIILGLVLLLQAIRQI